MRSYYGIVFSEFWTGHTGVDIRAGGKDAVILAFYLMTCRHATMIGLFRLPYMDIRHETGLGLKGIARAFDVLERAKFAKYDVVSQYVWVHEMAKFRLQLYKTPLKKDDKRVTHLRKLYAEADDNPFLSNFFARYSKDLHLLKRRRPLEAPYQGPSKALGSQKQKAVTVSSNQKDQDQNKPALARRDSLAVENSVENPEAVTV